MAWVFSTGRLVYNGTEVGTLSSVDIDQSQSLIPLQGNLMAPLANATGPGKLSGTAKFSAFDPLFLATIANAVMAATSGVSMVWYITDTAGVIKSLTMPAVTLTSVKLSGAMDKWLECTIGWEAACASGTGDILTVATEAGAPSPTASSGLWVFSAGEFTLQTHVVGTISNVDLDLSWSVIPLNSNYRYPVAVAKGPLKVGGSTKFSAFDTNFVETITNAVMTTPSSALTAVWHFHDSASGAHTITLPNVAISGWKLSGGVDKWLATDVTFEAAADPVTPFNIITVA